MWLMLRGGFEGRPRSGVVENVQPTPLDDASSNRALRGMLVAISVFKSFLANQHYLIANSIAPTSRKLMSN
jgi:hypothetical protein